MEVSFAGDERRQHQLAPDPNEDAPEVSSPSDTFAHNHRRRSEGRLLSRFCLNRHLDENGHPVSPPLETALEQDTFEEVTYLAIEGPALVPLESCVSVPANTETIEKPSAVPKNPTSTPRATPESYHRNAFPYQFAGSLSLRITILRK